MIRKFAFKNFAGFKAWSELDFTFDGNVPADIKQGRDISTLMLLKGANGSGKTNALRAFTFLFSLLNERVATRQHSDKIELPVDTFFNSKEPVCFYLELEVNASIYRYDLVLSTAGIASEELSYEVDGQQSLCIKRNGESVTNGVDGEQELCKLKLHVDKPITVLITSYNLDSSLSHLEVFQTAVQSFHSNLKYDGLRYSTQVSSERINQISKIYLEEPVILETVMSVLKQADAGIEDIEIREDKTADGKAIYLPVFHHYNQREKYALYFDKESQGVKNLFLDLFDYVKAIHRGGLLIVDEFDTHIHADILPILVDLFAQQATNPQHAQLLVTAHNTEIIDTTKRYRTAIVEKEDNECFLYRLDEIPTLRNDRSLIPSYRTGKIGGVPKRVLKQRQRNDEVMREQ
jgi:AAA15 family ATPase/GTPase